MDTIHGRTMQRFHMHTNLITERVLLNCTPSQVNMARTDLEQPTVVQETKKDSCVENQGHKGRGTSKTLSQAA